MRLYLFFLFLLTCHHAHAQGFLMSHFFKPGMKIGVEYQPYISQENDEKYDLGRARIGLSLPIKSKLGLAVKPDKLELENIFNPKKWGKIPQNLASAFRPKAHQIFWNFNGHSVYQQQEYLPSTLSPLVQFGASTGITGFHYLRKARVLFYSANVGFLESQHSIQQLRPTANALVGIAQVTSLQSVLYLGAYVAYAEKRVLPIPIIGFDTRLAPKLRFNMTLPVQSKLTYKINKKNRLAALVMINGFFGGYQLPSQTIRAAHSFSYIKSGLQYNRKIGKRSKLLLEAGWASWRRVSNRPGDFNEAYRLPGAAYFGATFHRTFGKALFDGNMGNFLN